MKLDLNKIGLVTMVSVRYYLNGAPVFDRLRPSVPRLGELIDLGRANPPGSTAVQCVGVLWNESNAEVPQRCAVYTQTWNPPPRVAPVLAPEAPPPFEGERHDG